MRSVDKSLSPYAVSFTCIWNHFFSRPKSTALNSPFGFNKKKIIPQIFSMHRVDSLDAVCRRIHRVGAEIRRQAALSEGEIKHTRGSRDDKNGFNPHMFAAILFGRTNTGILRAKRGFKSGLARLGWVLKK